MTERHDMQRKSLLRRVFSGNVCRLFPGPCAPWTRARGLGWYPQLQAVKMQSQAFGGTSVTVGKWKGLICRGCKPRDPNPRTLWKKPSYGDTDARWSPGVGGEGVNRQGPEGWRPRAAGHPSTVVGTCHSHWSEPQTHSARSDPDQALSFG